MVGNRGRGHSLRRCTADDAALPSLLLSPVRRVIRKPCRILRILLCHTSSFFGNGAGARKARSLSRGICCDCEDNDASTEISKSPVPVLINP
jgi:hypothetical protein